METTSTFIRKPPVPRPTYPLPMKLSGAGRYLPKRLVTNQELETKYGFEAGWAENKLGIKERRWVEDETPSFMCAEAAKEAISNAELAMDDIDLIINASQSNDRVFPEGSAQVHRQLGLEPTKVATMSLSSSCLSFLYALDISSSFLAIGLYKTILIVDANLSSVTIDKKNPGSCLLLGDGAAAVVVTRSEPGEKSCLNAALTETYGSTGDHAYLGNGDNSKIMFDKNVVLEDFYLGYDSNRLQKMVMKYYQKFMARLWPKKALDQIDLFVPNQANLMGIQYLKLIYPADKIMVTLDKHGNVGSTGFPIAIYEAIKSKRIQRGDLVLASGAGSGIALAGIVFTY